MKRINELLKIFYIFAILGLQMFGNLATMIPIFERELINKRNLISKNDLLDSISLGRCGPGAAVINTVVYLGNTIYGFGGGVFAVLGFIVFPFLTILLILFCMNIFENKELLNNFFIGGLSYICILIAKSMFKFGKSALINKITLFIFIITLVISLFIDIPVYLSIIITVIISLLFKAGYTWHKIS